MAAPNMNLHFFTAARSDVMAALTGKPSALERDRIESHDVATRIAGGASFNPDVGFEQSFDYV